MSRAVAKFKTLFFLQSAQSRGMCCIIIKVTKLRRPKGHPCKGGHLFYRCLVVSNATPGQLPLSLPRDPPKAQTRFETKRGGMFSFTESCPCSFSKAPQSDSNNAQPFNKSFNKAVHLTFYCRSRPRRTLERKKKVPQKARK